MPLPATAQPSAAKADPVDPNARAPAVEYESAFTGYAPYREEKLAPWRDVNDEVARAGGHIGILRGAGSAPPATQLPAAAAPGDHSEHKR
jgi:hypothetical protein